MPLRFSKSIVSLFDSHHTHQFYCSSAPSTEPGVYFVALRHQSRPPVNWWLAEPLKGAITGRAPKGARKIWSHIIISGSRSRAAVFLCLTILATRKRVCILFNRHLIQSIIFFQLVSDIFRNHFLVSPDRVHIISPAPEFS